MPPSEVRISKVWFQIERVGEIPNGGIVMAPMKLNVSTSVVPIGVRRVRLSQTMGILQRTPYSALGRK